MAKKLSTFRNEDFFNFDFKQSQKSGKGVTEEVIRSTADVIVAIDGTGDFEELQEAINEVSSTGGYIQVKEGTYNLKSTINLANNIRIEGVGENTIFTTNKNLSQIFYGNLKNNITIENLLIDGNNKTNIKGIEIDNNSSKKINIKNCKIKNCNVGVDLNIIADIIITNNYFLDNNTSLVIDNIGNGGIIANNNILYDSAGKIGISIGENSACQSINIVGNIIFYDDAIKIYQAEISIVGNLIEQGDINLTANSNNNYVAINNMFNGSIIDNGTNNKIITAENSINNWKKSGSDLYYNNGNVSIGTSTEADTSTTSVPAANLIQKGSAWNGTTAVETMLTKSFLMDYDENINIGWSVRDLNDGRYGDEQRLLTFFSGNGTGYNSGFKIQPIGSPGWGGTISINYQGNYKFTNLSGNPSGIAAESMGQGHPSGYTSFWVRGYNADIRCFFNKEILVQAGRPGWRYGNNSAGNGGNELFNINMRTLIDNPTATNTALRIKGAASQSANLLEWQDSTSSSLGVIDSDGNIGIGKISPSERLNVNGNIYIENGNLIMDSPTKKWKIEIDDNGNIITTQI